MNIAFIVDPLAKLKAYKDSSIAMMRECVRRGHTIYALEAKDLYWKADQVYAYSSLLKLQNDEHDWYVQGETQHTPLAWFDVVLMRKDPPFDMEYVYSTYLLESAEQQGARVFNKPRAIRDHNEKLAITRYADFIAPTLVTSQTRLIKEFLAEHGDIIVKPLDGMGGTSIFRIRHDDPNTNVIIETLTRLQTVTIMAQRFIPEIAQGDKRLLLIAGEPVPYVLARIPQPGETRGNLAAGGRGVAQALSARDSQIAEEIGPRLWAEGLLIVGLDIIGDYLTEINVTSPTCFVEIAQQTGCNVAGRVGDALEKL